MPRKPLIVTPQELKSFIQVALAKSIDLKDEGKFKGRTGSNSLRSARFVWEISKCLWNSYADRPHLERFVQIVHDDGTKEGGEWMLDVAIAHTLPFLATKAQSLVNTELVWAVESEYSTRREEFAKDFGKLLCVRSENKLYLNGFNHPIGHEGRFIDNRVQETSAFLAHASTIGGNSQISGFDSGTLYLSFWPSPERDPNGKASLWDTRNKSDLVGSVRLFKFDWERRKFEEIN
jgi:hypothetical protein